MKISELFTLYGSDKATEHSYGEFYDELTSIKLPTSILEVGVEAGYSMTAWRRFVPEALVLGLDKDVTPDDSLSRMNKVSRERIRRDRAQAGLLRHGDKLPPYERMPNLHVIQCEVPDFGRVINQFRHNNWTFDLIIDDASHLEDHMVLTWHYLNEFLAPGGIYVIEDLPDDEYIKRFARAGWEITDLRQQKNRWDDVLAVKKKDAHV